MNRMVFSVFKAIALSMIFVFVWDMGFYLYRTFALNQRMEILMSSMTKVVQENNYLPEEEANVYKTLFQQLMRQLNGTTNGAGNPNEIFVNGFDWNLESGSYATRTYTNNMADINATVSNNAGNSVNRNILVRYMNTPACYGDIMVCYVSVNVNTPFWSFNTNHRASSNPNGNGHNMDLVATNGDAFDSADINSADNWVRNPAFQTIDMNYVYYVPCMHYTSVTD